MELHSVVPRTAQRYLKRENTHYPLSMSPLVGLEHLKLILLIPPKDRTPAQIQTLAESTKHIKFFAELINSEGPEAHRQCVQIMTYLSIKTGEFLFHAGDEGGCFYIILSGSVAVLAPFQKKEGKVDYNLLTILRSGDNFGELALISNKPRAASILAREPTAFAVLERSDYLRLLSKIQDARLTAKVDLLQHHPAFRLWTRLSLQKLSYFFKPLTFKRKQVVFHSGQPAESVYLIQSGDFQLLKSVGGGSSTQNAEVTLISTGELIGDQEVLANGCYSYTCSCASTIGYVLVISKADFLERIVNEESRGCLLDLNKVKEDYRRRRLEKITKLEGGKKMMKSSLSPVMMRRAEGEGVQVARAGLRAAVRKRWHLPHSHEGSLILEKTESVRVLRKSQDLLGYSQSLQSPVASTLLSTQTSFQKPKSWVDLVVHKYFRRRTKSGVIFSQLEEPLRVLHSSKTTATHSHRNSTS